MPAHLALNLMSSNPLVGIAIPAFCSAKTLRFTLESCVRQSHQNWLAVVTVDGSEGEEEERIAAGLADPRIRFSLNGRTLGQYWNFNRAMLACHHAGADWIKPLCADDLLLPDALARLLAQAADTPQCGLGYGYFDCIDSNGHPCGQIDLTGTPSRSFASGDFLRAALPSFNPVGGPSSVMISREAFERCGGFDDRFPWAADQILWYRIARRFGVAVVGERPILLYRKHENSVTSRFSVAPNRFSDPVNLGQDICLGTQPPSVDWYRAQDASGTAMGAGWLTSAALMRRGRIREGLRGLYHSTAQARLLWFPFALRFLLRRLALEPLGWHRKQPLSPRWIDPRKVRQGAPSE